MCFSHLSSSANRPPSTPTLVLMAPTQAPLSGDSTALVCLARAFYPDDAIVTWSENGGTVTGTEVQTGVSQRQADATYKLSSVLTLTSARWSSGHTFTCQLTHSSLSSPLSKSVISDQCVGWERSICATRHGPHVYLLFISCRWTFECCSQWKPLVFQIGVASKVLPTAAQGYFNKSHLKTIKVSWLSFSIVDE